MPEFSMVDGFVEITESLSEMIKYIANEPSAGLFYIQQHTQNAVPNIVNLKNNILNTSHETTLDTEDSEDSITMLKSMKECGIPIADDMIRDIKKSLAIMSKKQPKRGLNCNPEKSSSSQTVKTSPFGLASWQGGERGSYISTMFKTAREKATNLKWKQFDPKESVQTEVEKLWLDSNTEVLAAASVSSGSSQPKNVSDKPNEEDRVDVVGLLGPEILSASKNYEDFKADKENELQEWLGGT